MAGLTLYSTAGYCVAGFLAPGLAPRCPACYCWLTHAASSSSSSYSRLLYLVGYYSPLVSSVLSFFYVRFCHRLLCWFLSSCCLLGPILMLSVGSCHHAVCKVVTILSVRSFPRAACLVMLSLSWALSFCRLLGPDTAFQSHDYLPYSQTC